MSYQQIINGLDLKSMNLRRMDVCIKVMQRVVDNKYAFDLGDWQQGEHTKTSEKELHKCGSAACFAGWLAVSPEFRRSGGTLSQYHGIPRFKGRGGDGAINSYLNLSAYNRLGPCIVFSDSELYESIDKNKIQPRSVLARLKYAKKVAIKQKAAS